MRSMLALGLPPGNQGGTGADALLSGYVQGLAFLSSEGDGYGQVSVRDAATPANDLANALAYNLITQSGTSPKRVKQVDGSLAWSAHNLLPTSNNIASGYWAESGASRTPTTVTDANAGAFGYAYVQFTTISGPYYTYRVYVKKEDDETSFPEVNMFFSGNVIRVMVNKKTGATAEQGVTVNGTYTVSAATINGVDYWELALTVLSNSTTGTIQVHASRGTVLGTANVAAQGTTTFIRPQVNRGTVPTDYVETTGATGVCRPAFEWDGSQWQLLTEPAATNLALQANDFTSASWTKTGGGGISAAKTATGPDGVANSASTLTASGADGTALQAITSASSARVTSVWMKRRTGTGDIDLTQDNGSTWTTQAVTSTWTRFELATVTSANPTVGIRIVTSGDQIDVWGFQHETGTVVTSTIETFGATVTRAADADNFALSLIPHSATAETLIWSGTTPKAAAAAVLFQMDNGTANERIRVEYTGTNVRCILTDGGSATATLDLGAVAVDTSIKVAFSWEADDVAASLNGGTAVTDSDTSGGLPAVTTARLAYSTTGERGVDYTSSLVIVPEALQSQVSALSA